MAVGFWTGVIGFIIGLFILLATAAAVCFYRRRQAGILQHLATLSLRNQTLLELASDGIHVLDDQGNVVEVNAAFCRMLGYTREEALQLNVADWDAQWSAEELLAKVRELIAPAAHPLVFETQHRRKDGALRDVEINCVAITLDGRDYLYASARDITERKRTEKELKNLRTAVEQSASTIVITDRRANIEYVNPAFEKITGYTAAEAIGQNPRILKSGEQDAAFYQQLWATITSGNIWRGQFHNKRKDGALYWESATISPVHNDRGDIVHFIAVKENITERKALEDRLSEALLCAESANHAKSEFLAVMSHELRTPLNGVLGFAELLSETPLNDEQREYAQTISASGNHLLAVVNDILDFSSIEKGRLTIQAAPVTIAKAVATSLLAIRKSASDKRLEFRCETDPGVPEQIIGDERRIIQVLINLLSNAVKFTSSGSVVLHIAPASDEGRPALDFSVQDTGIGISPEMLDLLFQPFTQADSTMHRPFEGTGLGLAISRRLAEAMGGSLSVVSTPGKGSTFTLHLPLEISPPTGGTGVPPVWAQSVATGSVLPHTGGHFDRLKALSLSKGPPMPPENKLVLVVEDDPDNSLLAGKMLESLGYRVEFAADGAEAVEAFAPGKYFAILMDMRLPVMDGLAATRKIREHGVRVPIIALTANVMPGDRECCLADGMDDYLLKPFKRAELAAKLARFTQP
jgi:PAS domain S-box-containing protein